MQIVETRLKGCVVIDVEPHVDSRGMFARTFCAEAFARAELPTRFVQWSLSRNTRAGTLRGLHFQLPPSREGKLVRCTAGRIFDVAVDIRSSSATYLQHVSFDLSAENCRSVYLPPGIAHGFQTLSEYSDVSYAMTDVYRPEAGAGLRWNDSRLNISWPIDELIINERDRDYSDVDDAWLRSLNWNQALS